MAYVNLSCLFSTTNEAAHAFCAIYEALAQSYTVRKYDQVDRE